MSTRKEPISLVVAQSAMCAVLYAVGAYLTAYISSPWGFGQFRPAAVIPAVFSTLFGPVVGGVGAAIGTLIADSVKHGHLYIRSLVSAVPGNFIGFYIFGLLVRRFSWRNFIKATQVSLLIGNFIVAFLYVYFRAFIEASLPVALREVWIYVSLGLVAWWYVTMLPFVLLLGPPLIRAVYKAFPTFFSERIGSTVSIQEMGGRFSTAMLLPGLLMASIGIGMMLTGPEWLIKLKIVSDQVMLMGMGVMFTVGGSILIVLGLVLATGKIPVRLRQI
ncbi:MAG: ECF transporter S component [Candidatus Bathyarchaeia archaeon]